jgi:hypothetical protein
LQTFVRLAEKYIKETHPGQSKLHEKLGLNKDSRYQLLIAEIYANNRVTSKSNEDKKTKESCLLLDRFE